MSKPVRILPETRARDLRDLGGVLVNRGNVETGLRGGYLQLRLEPEVGRETLRRVEEVFGADMFTSCEEES